MLDKVNVVNDTHIQTERKKLQTQVCIFFCLASDCADKIHLKQFFFCFSTENYLNRNIWDGLCDLSVSSEQFTHAHRQTALILFSLYNQRFAVASYPVVSCENGLQDDVVLHSQASLGSVGATFRFVHKTFSESILIIVFRNSCLVQFAGRIKRHDV